MSVTTKSFPTHGEDPEEILARMAALRERDARWREGQVWSLVFDPGEELREFLGRAYTMFLSENGLNPTAFPSLRQLELEVVAMTAQLLGGTGPRAGSRDPRHSGVVGNMTSGGTESILMAVKAAREWGCQRLPRNRTPELVLPVTAHPAFDKAAHYFGLRAVHVPVGTDYRADVAAMRRAITRKTVLLVGSAPQYPHGVVDPIADIAQLAQRRGLLCHVDACVGGFMLPFVRDLGYPVPPFDFAVPGVTSMSVDLHKYGYAAKGASVVLYRDAALRRHQYFAYTDWPGGIYVSPSMTGTRPGGAIAAAWAILHRLGFDGYRAIAGEVMAATASIRAAVDAIEGLRVLGSPAMSVMAIAGDGVDIYQVGDEMTARGWHLDRQQFPPSLHLTINRAHVKSAERFVDDLQQAAVQSRLSRAEQWKRRSKEAVINGVLRTLPRPVTSQLTRAVSSLMGLGGGQLPQRSAAMYGMMASLPNRGDLRTLVIDVLDELTRPSGS